MRFALPEAFLEPYKTAPVDWGYGALSETVFLRSYSQLRADGTKERWWETCRRVIEAMFQIQRDHCAKNKLPWNQAKSMRSAKDAYARMFEFKWTPPGRGLARMGTPIIEKLGGMSLQNCSSTSTEDFVGAMEFLMDASLLGVGVGYDTAGAGKHTIHNPKDSGEVYIIPDSREGWVESTRKILMGFIHGEDVPRFDYSVIRPNGSPISTGGIAPGPGPLKLLHERLYMQFAERGGETLTITDVVDVGNQIGACVVSGGNRRTALIAIDDSMSDEFLELKDVEKNPDRVGWSWASNNSVSVKVGQDLSKIIPGIVLNGEPGVVYPEMAQNYGRLIDPPDFKDGKATCPNPCSEIFLESMFDKKLHKAGGELCNLVSLNMGRHETLDDFLRTIKYSFLYNKTVTLIPTHNEMTNSIVLRNRRIGASLSGVADFIDAQGMAKFREWSDVGYKAMKRWDETYSAWLCIRESIRLTALKPDGTVGSLSGSSPGIHFNPGGEFYVRRVNYTKRDPILEALKEAGYPWEQSVYVPEFEVVEFPVRSKAKRSDADVSAFEKMMIASEAQAYWADNLVSCTVSFDPETEGPQLGNLLQLFDGKIKGISFLPRVAGGAYKQMPYETITEAEYLERTYHIKPLNLDALYDGATQGIDAEGESFCSNDSCEVEPRNVASSEQRQFAEEIAERVSSEWSDKLKILADN